MADVTVEPTLEADNKGKGKVMKKKVPIPTLGEVDKTQSVVDLADGK